MTEADYKAFLDAYSNYPSQDNEGYTPDRGSFKAGFFAGVRYKKAELEQLQEQWEPEWKEQAAASAAGYNESFEKFKSDLERLRVENARLREALELIAKREGMTQLHDCCVDRSCVPVFFDAEKVANCLFQYGVNRGFNECASDARAALREKE
jgi:hypothetical protein